MTFFVLRYNYYLTNEHINHTFSPHPPQVLYVRGLETFFKQKLRVGSYRKSGLSRGDPVIWGGVVRRAKFLTTQHITFA
jgi:hypothetical protein